MILLRFTDFRDGYNKKTTEKSVTSKKAYLHYTKKIQKERSKEHETAANDRSR